MFKKKWLISLTIMALMVSLAGCAKKPEVPKTTTPPAGTSQLPEGHPTDTSAQPGNKATQAVVETKINDVLNKNYPGEWKVAGTTLSKGSYTENGNYKIVDDVEKQFPDTMGVSIFVGEERISSSVKQQDTGARVLKGYATPPAVGEVMKSGQSTSTVSSGYLKVYVPLKSGGKTVAVLTVSTPQS
ncbi:MAG: cache domain-containing protein [Bacillota bacterium]|nr:cache domain-containing protein [Bacillota bacterium]MDP4159916.1 cache domain-containing protein [Bacillota bacterium]